MHAQAAAEGWPGDGTASSPYIIGGYAIDASGATGIYLSDVRVHVEIRGNTITDPIGGSAHQGIRVIDSRAWLVDNTIAVEGTGIFVRGAGPTAPDDDFINATVQGASNLVFGPPASLAPIRGNEVKRASTGIVLSDARLWTVANNEIHNTGAGIYASPSHTSSPIQHNKVADCTGTGIAAVADEGGSAAAVTDNTITACGAGISTFRATSIADNTIKGVAGTGIHTDEGGSVRGNLIKGAATGIRSWGDPSSISGNTVRDIVGDGMNVQEAGGIEGNLVQGAGGHGIYIRVSSGAVSDNTVRAVGGFGISGASGEISGNLVEDTGSHGIVGTYSGCIASNTVTASGGDGIQYRETGCIVGNLVDSNPGHGIATQWATGSVRDNVVAGNGADGIVVTDRLDGEIRGNTIRDNGGDGIRAFVIPGPLSFGELYADVRPAFQVTDNSVTGNTGTGIDLTARETLLVEGPGLDFTRNQVSNNAVGIRLASFETSTTTGNRIDGNGVGISFESPLLADGFVPAPGAVEIGFHQVFDNAFDNALNAQADAGMAMKWYTDARPLLPGETNIAGGSWLGGNLWGNYAGTDADGDGLGDTPHQPTADPARLDRHPLV